MSQASYQLLHSVKFILFAILPLVIIAILVMLIFMKKQEKDENNKRIYVREDSHYRYKLWAAAEGLDMIDALNLLLDRAEELKKYKKKEKIND